MDAVERVLAVLPQVHGPRAQGVAGAARDADAAAQLAELAAQIALAGDHLLRRVPVRPFLLVVDRRDAGPGETLAPDANAVAHRAPALLDVVEVARPRIDDDRARRLAAQIGHAGAKVSRVDARQRRGRDREALPRDRAVEAGEARVEAAAAEALDRGRRLRARHDRDLAAGGKARRRKAGCGPGEDGTSTKIRHGSLQASSGRYRHEGRRGEALSFAKLARPINAGIAAGPRSHAAVRNQP